MQMMISPLSKQMFLTKVLEHFQVKVTFKLTRIANLLLFQQEIEVPMSVREKFKEEVQRLEVLKSLLLLTNRQSGSIRLL